MRDFVRALFVRHERDVDHIANLKAGLAAVVGMLLVGYLAQGTGQPLLLAPLGATSALLFAQPSSPLAQPLNVMMGYLVGSIACEAAFRIMPSDMVAAAAAVGVTVVVMRGLRVTHPPAGALPLLVFSQNLHGLQLFGVVLAGCLILIGLAFVVHRIPPRRPYPLPAAPPTIKVRP